MGKVISALTGLAELHNLITVAGENREKGRGQEARDGRHEDEWEVFFKCQSVCVCVCVWSNSQRLTSVPFQGAC